MVNIIATLSTSSDDFLHAFLLRDRRKACKESSNETESVEIIFSAEINLLWQLNRVLSLH